jgi:hypothetical protein
MQYAMERRETKLYSKDTEDLKSFNESMVVMEEKYYEAEGSEQLAKNRSKQMKETDEGIYHLIKVQDKTTQKYHEQVVFIPKEFSLVELEENKDFVEICDNEMRVFKLYFKGENDVKSFNKVAISKQKIAFNKHVLLAMNEIFPEHLSPDLKKLADEVSGKSSSTSLAEVALNSIRRGVILGCCLGLGIWFFRYVRRK